MPLLIISDIIRSDYYSAARPRYRNNYQNDTSMEVIDGTMNRESSLHKLRANPLTLHKGISFDYSVRVIPCDGDYFNPL